MTLSLETTTLEVDALQSFCQFFLDLVDKQVSGTLVVYGQDDERCSLLYREGGLIDIDVGGQSDVGSDGGGSLLLQAFLATGSVSDRELKKAQKKAAKGDRTVGQWLLGRKLVTDDEILERVVEAFTDRVCAVFASEVETFEFYEHGPDERIEDFNDELSEVFDLFFGGEDLFVEAARRLDRWDLVRESFGSLLDIYYATPQSMRYYSEPELYQNEIEVISKVDGNLDQLEIIESVELDPFDALLVLRNLGRNDEIQPINPVQMFQLGMDTVDKGDHGKARKIFQRAIERGLDDFDVQFKLADCNAALKNYPEAVRQYRGFAEKCALQLRFKGSIVALRKVLAIDPRDAEAQRVLLDLLFEHDSAEAAVHQAIVFSKAIVEAAAPEVALDILTHLRDKGCDDPKLRHQINDVTALCGDGAADHDTEESTAAINLDDPTDTEAETEAEDDTEVEESLESYERRFAQGDESLGVRLKLIHLHLDEENETKARNHVDSILGTKQELEIRDPETLAWLHKTRLSLAPGHMISSRWLVDYYTKKGHMEDALAVLRNHIAQLEKEGNQFLILEARKRLVVLDKDNYDPRWQLVKHYRDQGRLDKAIHDLRQIARIATKQNDAEIVRQAWTELHAVAPYDRDALYGLAVGLKDAGDEQGSLERLKTVALLDILNDNLDGAEKCLETIQEVDSEDPDLFYRLGVAFLERNEKERGLELLDRSIDLFLKSKDLGHARAAIERSFCEAPGKEEIIELKDRLEGMEQALDGKPNPPPESTRGTTTISKPSPAPKLSGQPTTRTVTISPPGGLPEYEPFQGRRQVTKTTVNAITARLKGLKGGSKATSSGGKVIVGGLNKIKANLKNLKQSGPVPTVPMSGGAASSPEKTAGGDVPSDFVGDPTPPTQKLKGVASKLKALAAAGGADAGSTAASGETAGDASGDNSTGGDKPSADAVAAAVKASQAGGVKVKKSMGGAASRLAKLKALKQQGESANEPEEAEEPA